MKQSEWKWFGNPGHLLVADDCVFHLNTLVGKYIVSTVGDYFPFHNRPNGETETIGVGRKYETSVFLKNGVCVCGCGNPKHDEDSLDFEGYNEAKCANEGHLKMCKKWSKK